jgi:hypothetical protein
MFSANGGRGREHAAFTDADAATYRGRFNRPGKLNEGGLIQYRFYYL